MNPLDAIGEFAINPIKCNKKSDVDWKSPSGLRINVQILKCNFQRVKWLPTLLTTSVTSARAVTIAADESVTVDLNARSLVSWSLAISSGRESTTVITQ